MAQRGLRECVYSRGLTLMGCRETLTTKGLVINQSLDQPQEAGLHAGQLSQVPCLGKQLASVQMML